MADKDETILPPGKEVKPLSSVAKVEPEPKAAPKPKGIRAVYGTMVDPHTGLHYGLAPTELYKETPWVRAQIEAKKMELVDL